MLILDITTAYISYICSYIYFKFQQPQLLAVTKSLLFTVIRQEFGIISWGLWTKTWPIFWARASDSASATWFQWKVTRTVRWCSMQGEKKEKRMCCHDCVERWCHSKFSGELCKLLWLGLLSKEACLHQNSSNFSHLVCWHCATSQQTLTQSRFKLWRKTSAEQKHLELKQMAFPCISRGYLVNTSFEAQLTNIRALHCSCPIPLRGSLNITPESLFKRHRLIRARHTILNTL